MSDARVEQWLADLMLGKPEQYAVLAALREQVLALPGSVGEEVKYGGLLYSAGGEAFCGLFAYARHVSLELGEGARLPDPTGLLEGGGKHRRHLKFRSLADIEQKRPGDFLTAALALALS